MGLGQILHLAVARLGTSLLDWMQSSRERAGKVKSSPSTQAQLQKGQNCLCVTTGFGVAQPVPGAPREIPGISLVPPAQGMHVVPSWLCLELLCLLLIIYTNRFSLATICAVLSCFSRIDVKILFLCLLCLRTFAHQSSQSQVSPAQPFPLCG